MAGPPDAAFEAWCADVWPRLVRVVRPYCDRPGDAEDLAQEALVRSVARFDRTAEVPPVTWAMTVVMNLGRSRLRRLRVERRHAEVMGRERLVDAPVVVDDTVLVALGALPERRRRAVALRYLADLSVEDTAAVMGCTPATVKAHVRDAFADLRANGLLDDREEVRDGRG